MGVLGGLIQSKIKQEVQKLIDSKVQSAVVNGLFPSVQKAEGYLSAQAHLNVKIQKLDIEYTEHLKKGNDVLLTVPEQEHPLELKFDIPVSRPKQMSGSNGLQMNNFELSLSGTLQSIEF